MLTTDTANASTGSLVAAAAVSLAAGLSLVVAGALLRGEAAAYGALVGTGVALAVFVLGGLVVDVVSRRMPALSLLVALLTYTLQVVAMAAVFATLSRGPLLDSSLDRQWLGGAVIVAVIVWLGVQVPLLLSRRIPVYELPQQAGE